MGSADVRDSLRKDDGEGHSVLLRREVQRIGFLIIFVAKFKGGYRYEEIVLLDR
jgi:hypothetical protein